MTNPDQGSAPSPFSRQGSDPSDALGADPAAAPASPEANSWPTYSSTAPMDPAPPESYPGYSSATPYGSPPAPGFDPQPTPPYGGYADPTPPAPPADPYGSTPYAANPYASNPSAADPHASNPYEVNPYQPSYGGYGAYGIVATIHPQAVPALVTGILGLAICPFVGIAGLVLGNKARKAIDAEPGRFTGRGQATAGFVLGIISIVYAVLWVVFVAAGMSGALDN